MKLVRRTFVAAAILGMTAGLASAEPVKLLLTSMSPAGSENETELNKWAEKVEADSNGTLDIEVRAGTTLANYGNVVDRVTEDLVQIGWAVHPFLGERFPLSLVAGVPFVAQDPVEGGVGLWKLYETGMLDEEYKGLKPLWFVTTPQSNIHYAKEQADPADLTGKKFAVLSKVHADIVEALGGTPIAIQSPEFYESLQRGTVDAGIISWGAFAPFKLAEVTHDHLEAPLGANSMVFFMTQAKFDSLPPEAQAAIEKHTGEAMSREFAEYFIRAGNGQRDPVAASPDHRVIEMTEEQRAKWETDIVGPILAQWASSRAGGEEALAKFREFVAEIRAGG